MTSQSRLLNRILVKGEASNQRGSGVEERELHNLRGPDSNVVGDAQERLPINLGEGRVNGHLQEWSEVGEEQLTPKDVFQLLRSAESYSILRSLQK